ncbi:unnamed protein product [Caenorhabditis sp. 36 PRJEB53466]|nr:unnamed protein product [Caenorhabditis sp. 36 PRJEB53466]
MVKATSLDLSLNDIIKNKKKTKIVRKSTGGIKKRNSVGGAGSAATTPRRRSAGVKKAVRNPVRNPVRKAAPKTNDKRTVRINLSNLAPTVVSTDLRELFGEFQLRAVHVNFDERGTPLGTGDISLSKVNADRLVQKYAGVALDGKVMQFAIIDTAAFVAATPEAKKAAPLRNLAGNGRKVNAKSPKAAPAGNAKKRPLKKKPTKETKSKKTAEELDAELDAYMSRQA